MSDEAISVMIVDDTAHVRRMLRSMLEIDGFSVVGEASSGEEALEVVGDANPDVVVIDYKMPDIDGLEASRRIRLDRPDQMVILYTAFVDDDLQKRAREAGVAVVLGKVEGLESLEREIARLCGTMF
jgi:CheY-like chemotaxis protein